MLRRVRGRVGAALIAGALLIPATAWAAAVIADGPLTDLSVATDAFDDASARVVANSNGNGTTVVLHVSEIDPAVAGSTFGSHVHEHPCAVGAGGGHFNTGGAVLADSEVWLDFDVNPSGMATSTAHVDFPIESGQAGSVVIHANPTDPATGAAGARLACIDVDF